MKKMVITLLALSAIMLVNAQQTTTEEQKPKLLEPYGYVRYEAFMDTRKMVESREGELMMYPKAEDLDDNGDDINAVNQFKMLSLQSRLGTKINGPDAFGAKTSGLVEMDFYGVKDDVARMIRLRHAYVKFDWGKAKILMGQTWHMIIVPECNPGVIGFGAAAPFHPLNRCDQIRFDLGIGETMTWGIAAATYGYHNSTGSSTEAQRNSGLPDIHTQFKFKNDIILAGVTAGLKWLQPRLETANGLKTKEKLTGYDLQAFLKLSLGKITLKTAGVYGQNLSMYSMLGGYCRDTATLDDDYSYVNLNSYSAWLDFEFKAASFISTGIFFGYSGMTGASEPALQLIDASTGKPYPRGYNLDHIMRISPRVAFTSGKTELALEYDLDQAVYGSSWDEKQKVTEKNDPVYNMRILLSAKYSF